MNYTLKYQSRVEVGGTERRFSYICPDSSGTPQKQKLRIEPPGLTLVAYVPHGQRGPFLGAINALSNTRNTFKAFEQLHFTIRGLFGGEPWRTEELEPLTLAIAAFLQSRKLHKLDIEFDLVCPGVFVGRPDYSDGTVVAMANELGDQAIVDLSRELAEDLSAHFPQYFPKARRRPLAGVWCSLGYFDEPDFPVDESIFRAFLPLTTFTAQISVVQLAITEFTLKSLADGLVRSLILL